MLISTLSLRLNASTDQENCGITHVLGIGWQRWQRAASWHGPRLELERCQQHLLAQSESQTQNAVCALFLINFPCVNVSSVFISIDFTCCCKRTSWLSVQRVDLFHEANAPGNLQGRERKALLLSMPQTHMRSLTNYALITTVAQTSRNQTLKRSRGELGMCRVLIAQKLVHCGSTEDAKHKNACLQPRRRRWT